MQIFSNYNDYIIVLTPAVNHMSGQSLPGSSYKGALLLAPNTDCHSVSPLSFNIFLRPNVNISFGNWSCNWRRLGSCLNYYRRLLQAEFRKIIEVDMTTVTLHRLTSLSQSHELHWIDALFCQRTTSGSSNGQWINREFNSQPVFVVQKMRIFCQEFQVS